MTQRRVIAVFATLALLFAVLPFGAFAYSANDPQVDSWNVTSDGQNVTITLNGTVSNAWYSEVVCNLKKGDGSSGDFRFILRPADGAGSMNYNWGNVPGSDISVQGDTSGKYSATITIPLDFLGGDDFELTLGGTTVTAAEILGGSTDPDPTEPEPTEPEGPNPNKPDGPSVHGKIVVDGDLSDWGDVTGHTGGPDSSPVTYDGWKVTMDEDGNLYFCAWGTAGTEWASPQWDVFTITQNGQPEGIAFTNIPSKGGRVSIVNQANHNTPGPFYVEAMIPASMLNDPNFVFSFGNLDILASDIEVVDGTDVTPEPEDPVYDGIVIDGEFHDWDAVTKHDAREIDNGNGRNNLDSVAMVWDGDMVYIYIKESPGGSASEAGTAGNGRFSITSDLGNETMFQLNADGTVSGVNGATAAHVGDQWEIGIPASELPKYLESLSFGLYQQEPFVEDVVNLQDSDPGGTFEGIVYDGEYSDWDYYPHTRIDYSTAGTGQDLLDASGALWFDGDHTLFGHFYSELPQHVQMGISELTHGITFRFNDGEFIFWPRLLGGTEDDTDWNPDFDSLPDGSYEFLMANQQGWSDWQGNAVYGKMIVTKTGDKIECEFYLDLEVLAELFGCDASDLKMIEAQFGRLGDEWVTAAGASSGAYLGIGLSIAVVACVLLFKKKKKVQTA